MSEMPRHLSFNHQQPLIHSFLQKSSWQQALNPGLFRVSVGIEHIDDIISDFDQALKQALA